MRIMHWTAMVGLLVGIVVSQAMPGAAQPLCAGDTIWDEEENACVPLPTATAEDGGEDPVIPPTATSEPEATIEEEPLETPTPTEEDGVSERAGDGSYFLTILPYTCPRPMRANVSWEVAAEGCVPLMAEDSPFGFHIYAGGAYYDLILAGGDNRFPETPAGDLRVDASYSDEWGAPYASCWSNSEEVARQSPTVEGVIEAPDIPAGSNAHCVFLFAPAPHIEVTLVTEFCPQSVIDQSILGYVDLKAACQEPLLPVSITIGSREPAVRGTTVNGTVSFDRVGEGTIAITAAVPVGYAEPWFYCMVSGPDGQTIQQADLRLPDPDGALRIENLRYGEAVICDVFYTPAGNDPADAIAPESGDEIGEATPDDLLPTEEEISALTPADDTVYVGIVHRFCTLGARAEMGLDQLNISCPVANNGPLTDFYVRAYPDGSSTAVLAVESSFEVATVGANQARFFDVPHGAMTIGQAVPDGYEQPVIACQKWLDGEFVMPMTVLNVTQASVFMTYVEPGTLVTCVFYQMEDPANVRVDVIVYTCPASALPLATYLDLNAVCTAPGDEIEIQVVSSGGVANAFTFGGLATFDRVEHGEILVREFIPEGFGYPRVFCQVMGDAGQTVKGQDLEIIYEGGYVRVDDVPPHSSVLCEMFNLPGETPDQGSGVPVTWMRPERAA